MESVGAATGAPLPRNPPPKRSVVRCHILLGASLALATALLLSVLGPWSKVFVQEQQGLPSMADVYSGELTPLQRHVAFFDRDKDGVIYPYETYQGARAMGCGVALSAATAIFVNKGLASKTTPVNIKAPPFQLPIYVKNIHKARHGSHSGVYDASGRFVHEKFEEIFKKHAHTRPDALTSKELQEMLKSNRDPKDYKGWFAAFTQWKLLHYLGQDKDGFLHKDTLRVFCDGNLFERLEKDRKSKSM